MKTSFVSPASELRLVLGAEMRNQVLTWPLCRVQSWLKVTSVFPFSPALSAAGLNVTCSVVSSDLQELILLLVCRANALFLLALPSLQWGISTFWA